MGPGIVSAESSLCATIHWDLARVLGFVGTHPTPNPSQGCLVAKLCLALDIPSPLSLHSNSSFLFTLFQVLGICCLSFLAVFDLIPSPFSLPFKFFFPLNSVWSYCHLLSILIHSKLSSKCYLFFPSLHSKTCSSSLSFKLLPYVVYPFIFPPVFEMFVPIHYPLFFLFQSFSQYVVSTIKSSHTTPYHCDSYYCTRMSHPWAYLAIDIVCLPSQPNLLVCVLHCTLCFFFSFPLHVHIDTFVDISSYLLLHISRYYKYVCTPCIFVYFFIMVPWVSLPLDVYLSISFSLSFPSWISLCLFISLCVYQYVFIPFPCYLLFSLFYICLLDYISAHMYLLSLFTYIYPWSFYIHFPFSTFRFLQVYITISLSIHIFLYPSIYAYIT